MLEIRYDLNLERFNMIPWYKNHAAAL